MQTTATVHLFHGLDVGAARHKEAMVRSLTGYDEALIADADPSVPLAAITSSLIAAAVQSIGGIEPITTEIARRLTVGDRERLILAMCIMTNGDDSELVARCPSKTCGAMAEVPVRLSEFLWSEPRTVSEFRNELITVGPGGNWTLIIRPLTGADQEKACLGEPEAARVLMRDCVLELTDPAGHAVEARNMPSEIEPALSNALSELDPAAEAVTSIFCPSCGTKINAMLDGISLLRSFLAGSLYAEVYRMARAYHWSEADILALPFRRRKRYLAIAESTGDGA